MLRSIRFATLLGGLSLVCLLSAAPVEATHPRPAGASPIRLSLVPAYSPCTAPDRTHGPPLAFPSCNPPAQTSAQATVGTPDANGAPASFNSYFRLAPASVLPGPPEEADIFINIPLNDVRCVPTGARCGSPNASGPADYSGEIDFTFTVRLTDHWNATVEGGGPEAATVEDMSFDSAGYRLGQTGVPCAETASTSTGSTCEGQTTLNSMIPGAAKEKRAVWEITSAYVSDGGTDGDAGTTGDNTVFLRPGIFIP